MKIGEANTGFCQGIDVKRAVALTAVATGVTVAQIVGHDQHNIWWPVRCIDH